MTDTARTGSPARRRIAGQRRRPADTPGTTPAPADDRNAEDTRVDVPAPAVHATVPAPAEDSATTEVPAPPPANAASATDARPDAATQATTDAATGEADDGATDAATNVTTEVATDVATDEADDAAEPGEDGGAADGGRARTQRLLAGALGVLVVLTLTGGLFLGQKAWQGRNTEQAQAGASAAARTAAELVLSYDYRQLDKSFAAARATLSPDFADDFDQTAKVVGEQATKTKATVRAEVREVAVRDGDADRVTLLVFVNQTTTSTITQGKPRIDLNRARFTMIRSGDTWQVQQIEGL